MGILDIFKRKKQKPELSGSHSRTVVYSDNTDLVNSFNRISSDLIDLLWIGDGDHCNYSQEVDIVDTFVTEFFKISLSFKGIEEPSLIYTNLQIRKPKLNENVDKPPYFPSYSKLTPEQRWIYLTFLTNPYVSGIDIGYVFLLYYGLERHLLCGDFEKAVNVIIKLRDVHTNKSFQSYSGNAIVLTCLLHQRPDYVLKFIDSLDTEHKLVFSDNLLLICKRDFGLPLYPKDIIRMRKTFSFTKTNYINKYPEMFLNTMQEVVLQGEGVGSVDLSKYIKDLDLKQARKEEVGISANISIMEQTQSVPIISEIFKFKKQMNNYLEMTHETLKKKLSDAKKSGDTVPENKAPEKPKKVLVFDKEKEKELLADLDEAKKDLVSRHFCYIKIQDFYYKYRDLDNSYLNKCVEYCLLDINSLPDMIDQYIDVEIKKAEEAASIKRKYDLPLSDKDDPERIREKGFEGVIPAFKRLVLIYKKQNKYEEAIDVCDKAISFNQSVEYFSDMKTKLLSNIKD